MKHLVLVFKLLFSGGVGGRHTNQEKKFPRNREEHSSNQVLPLFPQAQSSGLWCGQQDCVPKQLHSRFTVRTWVSASEKKDCALLLSRRETRRNRLDGVPGGCAVGFCCSELDHGISVEGWKRLFMVILAQTRYTPGFLSTPTDKLPWNYVSLAHQNA